MNLPDVMDEIYQSLDLGRQSNRIIAFIVVDMETGELTAHSFTSKVGARNFLKEVIQALDDELSA